MVQYCKIWSHFTWWLVCVQEALINNTEHYTIPFILKNSDVYSILKETTLNTRSLALHLIPHRHLQTTTWLCPCPHLNSCFLPFAQLGICVLLILLPFLLLSNLPPQYLIAFSLAGPYVWSMLPAPSINRTLLLQIPPQNLLLSTICPTMTHIFRPA